MKRISCHNVSPYLLNNSNVIIEPSRLPLFGQKSMIFGSKLGDGGNLIIDDINDVPIECRPYVRRFISTKDFLYDVHRWCLYLRDASDTILKHPFIKSHLKPCRLFRLNSAKASTKNLADKPHLFLEERIFNRSLYVPRTFSSTKSNIITSYIDDADVASGFIIPEASLYDFGILSSAMHMVWVRITCGKFKSDYRYSNTLCWNAFPYLDLPAENKRGVEDAVNRILNVRAMHSTECLGNLYLPDRMPANLKEAHNSLDNIIDRLYCPDGFASDRERLECLLRMYEEKTSRIPTDINQWC